MKSLFTIGASALVMGLASIGGAQAQSLGAVIGDNLVGLQATFANGNWVNDSINIGTINGAVTLGQAGLDTATEVDLGAINVGVQGAASGAISVLPPLLSLSGAAEVGLGIDLGSVATRAATAGEIASSAAIETVVVGAVNTGDIASAVQNSALRASNSTTASTGSLATTISGSASSAASTTNTASSSAASSVNSVDFQGPSTTITAATEALSSGPLADVYAANRAFNGGTILGSVTAVANNMDLAGIGTTVVGAVNTGTISLGFDGSALNLPE
ncbi:hypothetical protein [Aureimonas jatrophae]|jgi:hypothetical protein|uniref:Uncharacterized protein n=1 Tax=Aureimonas jatrophae TaxID=1166073 RepID=A0A1H0CLE1_9HYPH|nr:hypothetical protein [Aureimonas jatrophae]MBB3949286.1 hypothetical protein [Aureimonas jatrophae]SDN58684.1 hypothetical protein SAMN05192530_101363 [Aureimonas jatrophae]